MRKKIRFSPDECSKCDGACCRYVIIDLDYEPRSEKSFDEIIWFLYHNNMKILKEGRRWALMVMSDCKNLLPDNRCKIYDSRPDVCRDYPPKNDEECHGPGCKYLDGILFKSAEELLKYLAEKRKYKWAELRLENG